MARALIVGCGCRGRSLGAQLLERGWAVRGTSRGEDGLAAIEAAGIEPALADPERPATVLDLVADATVVHWLLGSARAGPKELAAIHGDRLERLLERLVETPVRGFLYEGAGSVEDSLLEGGAAAVRAAAERWRIPVAILEAGPADPVAWVEAALAATLELAQPAGGSI
jgi:nucleoside-diphosphate-sugar epimerase